MQAIGALTQNLMPSGHDEVRKPLCDVSGNAITMDDGLSGDGRYAWQITPNLWQESVFEWVIKER